MSSGLSRAVVKKHIRDADRVVVNAARTYTPQTDEHRQLWPKILAAIKKSGDRGVWYSSVKAIGGGNVDYAAYLIGDLGVLRCPALE
jgi:hypothetical protein